MLISNITNDSKDIVSFRVLKTTKEYIKSKSKENELSQSEFVELAIQSYKNSENIELERNLNENTDNNPNPSFLMGTKATNEGIYDYLKSNPQASRFIFKKYKENEQFIKELCDPENPLYLEDVANNLMELYQISEDKENLEQIRNDVKKYTLDLDRLKTEIKSKEKDYDQIEIEFNNKQKQLENLVRLSGNIRSDPGLERIVDLIGQVKSFSEVMNNIAFLGFQAHPTDPNISIPKDKIDHFKLIGKNAEELRKYLESNEFLSLEYLDENRKKIKEQMEKEKQASLNEIESIKTLNPIRSIEILNNGISHVRAKLDQGEEMGRTTTFTYPGFGTVKGELDDLIKVSGNLKMQFANLKERGKEEKRYLLKKG